MKDPTPTLTSAEVERLARNLERHEWTVSASREMDIAAATLRALLARAERAEAMLEAVRSELSPPAEWPLHMAARAAREAAERAEADRDAALLRGIALGIEAAKAFLRESQSAEGEVAAQYLDALDPATIAKEASE